MDRKGFFTKSCQCGIASIIGLALIPNVSSAQNADNATTEELDKLKKNIDFAQHRFSDLLHHLDKYLDKETRLKLYQNLGESCASTYTDQLAVFKNNLKSLLDEQLKQDWLKEYDFNENSGILKLTGKPKEKCGCPLVQKGLTVIEFCNCSMGHMKKVYEVVTEKKIGVTLDGSILMGDDHCSFTITIS